MVSSFLFPFPGKSVLRGSISFFEKIYAGLKACLEKYNALRKKFLSNKEVSPCSPSRKILVLKMRELVYTGIFLFLAVVLIVLLVLMFRTEKAPEKRTSISTERYTAGVYSSPVTLGDTVVDVTVTVDPDRIKAIDLNNLSETTSTMYPLIRPAVEELEAQILEKQSTKDITWEATGKYTAGILLNAIEKALDQAEGSVFSE